MNNGIPKEFSWHITNPLSIEVSRPLQDINNCWAHAFVSTIGDKLCIHHNLRSIYLSSVKMTALLNDFNKSKGFDQCYLNNMGLSIDIDFVSDFLSYLKESGIMFLESCYPEMLNLKIITKNDFIIKKNNGSIDKDSVYNKNNFKIYDTILNSKSLLQCCIQCQNNKYVNILEDTLTECIIPCKKEEDKEEDKEDKENERYNFRISIDKTDMFEIQKEYDVIKIETKFNEDMIKIIQQTIKEKIFCEGPITATILTNKYYSEYLELNQNKNYNDVEIFSSVYENKSTLGFSNFKGLHAIVILGWGRDKKQNFWIIRDSNSRSYLKIRFSNYRNKFSSIGPDIIFQTFLNLEGEIIFHFLYTSLVSISPRKLSDEILDKYLKIGLLESA